MAEKPRRLQLCIFVTLWLIVVSGIIVFESNIRPVSNTICFQVVRCRKVENILDLMEIKREVLASIKHNDNYTEQRLPCCGKSTLERCNTFEKWCKAFLLIDIYGSTEYPVNLTYEDFSILFETLHILRNNSIKFYLINRLIGGYILGTGRLVPDISLYTPEEFFDIVTDLLQLWWVDNKHEIASKFKKRTCNNKLCRLPLFTMRDKDYYFLSGWHMTEKKRKNAQIVVKMRLKCLLYHRRLWNRKYSILKRNSLFLRFPIKETDNK